MTSAQRLKDFPHRTSSLSQHSGAMSEAAAVMRSQSGFISAGGFKELPMGCRLLLGGCVWFYGVLGRV